MPKDLIAFLVFIGMILAIAYVGIRYRIFKEEWGHYDEGEESRAANTEDDLLQRDNWSK